jgi:hypothetical protein
MSCEHCNEIFSIAEAADFMQVSEAQILRWIDSGTLPAVLRRSELFKARSTRLLPVKAHWLRDPEGHPHYALKTLEYVPVIERDGSLVSDRGLENEAIVALRLGFENRPWLVYEMEIEFEAPGDVMTEVLWAIEGCDEGERVAAIAILWDDAVPDGFGPDGQPYWRRRVWLLPGYRGPTDGGLVDLSTVMPGRRSVGWSQSDTLAKGSNGP